MSNPCGSSPSYIATPRDLTQQLRLEMEKDQATFDDLLDPGFPRQLHYVMRLALIRKHCESSLPPGMAYERMFLMLVQESFNAPENIAKSLSRILRDLLKQCLSPSSLEEGPARVEEIKSVFRRLVNLKKTLTAVLAPSGTATTRRVNNKRKFAHSMVATSERQPPPQPPAPQSDSCNFDCMSFLALEYQ